MEYDNLLEVIKNRRSVRKFKPKKIKMEDIMKVIEAGRWAASGRNTQPWEFIVITDEQQIRHFLDLFVEQREFLKAHCRYFRNVPSVGFLENAPALIFVCGDPRFKAAYPQSDENEELHKLFSGGAEKIYLESVSAAINNMLLAATS